MGVTLVSRNDFNRPHYYLIVQEFYYNLEKKELDKFIKWPLKLKVVK